MFYLPFGPTGAAQGHGFDQLGRCWLKPTIEMARCAPQPLKGEDGKMLAGAQGLVLRVGADRLIFIRG